MLRTLTTTGATALPIATVASPRLPAHNTRASGRWSFAAVAARAGRPATVASLPWLPRAACRPAWLALAWVATTLAVEMPGQTQWLQKNPSVSPPGRHYAAGAFDAARGVVLTYGGWTTAGPPLGDFWAWNGTSWSQIQPAIQPPGLLTEAAMVREGATGMMLLFGGWNGTAASNQTWRWNGTSWTNVTPSQSPSPRWAHAMAYDESRGVALLFGGMNGTALGDTWEWNTATSTWTERTPVPPALSPPARRGTALVSYYSPYMLLFGGTDLTRPCWRWNGSTWVTLQFQLPQARSYLGAYWDVDRCRFVMFGGFTPGGSGPLSDTWERQAADSATWMQRMVTGPSGRGGPLLVYDSVRHEAVLFGGTSDNSGQAHPNDTWVYRPVATASVIATCSGCGSPPWSLGTDPCSFPRIGQSFGCAGTGPRIAGDVPLMLFGAPSPSLPLCFLGRCDCTLCAYPLYTEVVPNGAWSLLIPNDITLVGGQFDNQILLFNVLTNSISKMSNGLRSTIGTM